nr:MAG TPA: hypothetical protein [Caudoviricetes sp.]
MSDFQKQTLKRYGRNFLIVCGFGLLVYGMIKSALVLYATVAIMVLTIVGACVWSMVDSVRWDWRLRGRLNKDEYEAYMACDRVFGFTTDKYLPTEEQIQNMVNETSIDKDTLWSMFEKLS